VRARTASVFLLLGIAGCAVPDAAPLPPDMRPTLNRKWTDAPGRIRWPEQYDFAGLPVPVVLPPGMLIDRFGSDRGTFFSPKGAPFTGRAMPYISAVWPDATYEVLRPVLVRTGTAAPWCDEPGGATQFKTDAAADWLVADGTLRRLPRPDPRPCPADKQPADG